MRIQDIYTVGMRVHQVLFSNKVHTVGYKSPEDFKRIWEAAVKQVKEELDSGKLTTIDQWPSYEMGDIDWNLVFDNSGITTIHQVIND